MLNKFYKLLSLIAAILILACGSGQTLRQPQKTYNREAMGHMIDGAIAELLGQPQTALLEYHQAAEIDSSSPGIYLALAENYYMLGEYKSSIRQVNKVLHIDPDNLNALELLAVAYEKLEQYPQAMQALQRYVELEPGDLEVLYNLTSLQVINQRYDAAFLTYTNLVERGLEDIEYRLGIGHLFLQAGAFDFAEKIYLDILDDFPTIEDPYLALAAVSKAQEDTAAAIGWYRKAVFENPGFNDAKAELVSIYQKNDQYDQAISFYQALIEKDSTNLDNKIALAKLYYQNGDTLKAARCFKGAVKKHPQSERAYLSLASLQKIMGDTLAAAETYEKALQENTKFLTIRARLRDIYVDSNRFEEAIGLYEPLKDADSTYVGAHIEIANLFMHRGDTLKAIKQMESLSKTHSNDWRVPLTLGRYYFIAGQHANAADLFNQALDKRQDIPALWILRGINYMRMDSINMALDNFTRALEFFPRNAEMNFYAGFLLNRARNFSQAIHYLQKALDHDSDNIQTMTTLASAYDELRDFSRSEALYQKLIQNEPKNPLILNNYAYHLAVRGIKLETALKMALEAIEQAPDNAAYLDTVGWIYFRMQEYEQAVDYIEQSLDLRDDSAEVYEHLGDAYKQLGKHDQAMQAWEKALELDPSKSQLKIKLNLDK